MYLELDRLSKQFDGKYAVHELSLGLEKGGLLCILGSSGCGKTTTLNMIGGFLKPDGGRVLLDGQDITALPPERRPVSTVFQSYGLFPHMSVLQNVTYGLKFRRYSRAEAREKGRRYLELVGLADRENAREGRAHCLLPVKGVFASCHFSSYWNQPIRVFITARFLPQLARH